MSNDEITDLEAFHTEYYYFIQSLGALVMEPSEACENYGHYNVAAELQLDCAAGVYLLNNPVCTFTDKQREAITSFADNLRSLPAEAVRFTDIKLESLVRMQHPAWISIRTQAQALLDILVYATKENSQYFSNIQSAVAD